MKYLVTGGAGFIGSALTRRLAAAGHQVTVFDDFSRGQLKRLRGVECQVVHGDVRNVNDLDKAASGCESIIHLAYLQGTQTFYAEPKQVLDVAIRGMSSVLSACERWGVGELLLVSSSEAYQVASVVPTPETIPLTVPDPLNPRYSYGGGKIVCEIMANAWYRTGVLDRLIIARPHNIYGPDMGREHVIPEFCIRMKQLAAQREGIIDFPIQGTGEETRSFCYIDDCISQLELLLGKAPEVGIYHVGTMDERTIADVAHAIAVFCQREIKFIPGSLPKGSPPRRLPDTAKIEALGYDASQATPFAAGVKKTTSWYWANA